jgi:hypothetical protein
MAYLGHEEGAATEDDRRAFTTMHGPAEELRRSGIPL